MAGTKNQRKYVFGLDIGTRSIVGTVGYRDGDNFIVAAQEVREHQTRSMLDGQIHDIGAVGATIKEVKLALEKSLKMKLEEVCIAAAGRVLRTIETSATVEYDEDKVITPEEVAGLTSYAIEKAYEKFLKENDTDMKFYCVGNSVIRYYMNGYQIGNLENHKARSIGEDIIVTFLPDDVVDGLYKAVEIAGLRVVNMTLEPIAAIAVAIPENYRMLNIALVDVGAGTSDISITKDGSIVAYGMIPIAGDSLTEVVAQNCLVDFGTAESIKRGIAERDEVEYNDIMLLPQVINKNAVLEMLDDAIENMTKQVADKILELNGGKPVSAVFVVGGGGKIQGYTEKLAAKLGIMIQRVALRGEEVMQNIIFQDGTKKDSLLVTPIGICLNFYEQNNNFIYVTFNDERIKLYNNSSLAVVDAAMHAGFPNDQLFPRRGPAVNYTVNGVRKIARGELGEPALITVNGVSANLYQEIKVNDVITVIPSVAGPAAVLPISKLSEVKGTIAVNVNGSKILLPKMPLVNGEIKSLYYDVQDGDKIVMLDYYTIKQVKEFMDVVLEPGTKILVNNEKADDTTLVYENFSVKWTMGIGAFDAEKDDDFYDEEESEEVLDYVSKSATKGAGEKSEKKNENIGKEPEVEPIVKAESKGPKDLTIVYNGKPVVMHGKSEYIFVDVFDFVDFDRTTVGGSSLVTNVNGHKADFLQKISEGDVVDIYWEQ